MWQKISYHYVNKVIMNFPIRTEIEVLSADEPKKIHVHSKIIINSKGRILVKKNRIIGWSVKETIGIGIINPKGINKLFKHIDK